MIINNSTSGQSGGAFYIDNNEVDLYIINSTITNTKSTSSNGGGIRINQALRL